MIAAAAAADSWLLLLDPAVCLDVAACLAGPDVLDGPAVAACLKGPEKNCDILDCPAAADPAVTLAAAAAPALSLILGP